MDCGRFKSDDSDETRTWKAVVVMSCVGVKREEPDEEAAVAAPPSKSAKSEPSAILRNSEGDAYAELGNGRKRCTVRKYKDAILVDVREFYEKDGAQLPGKKGISLTVEQWRALVANVSALDDEVKALEGAQ